MRSGLFLVLVFMPTPASAPAVSTQPADSLLHGAYWKQQGLNVLLPAWTEPAFHEETGAWLHKLRRTDVSQHHNTAVR
jgi:hypothetical protein